MVSGEDCEVVSGEDCGVATGEDCGVVTGEDCGVVTAYCINKMVILALLRLQLNDITSLPHWVPISPILLRLKACGQCVGCLQSNYVTNLVL